MKIISKAVAIVALAWFAIPDANAQAFPGTTSPTGTALIVTIWDPDAGVSLVYAIPGQTFQSARTGLAPFSLQVPDFDTVFGGNTDSVVYQVSALGFDGNGRQTLLTTGGETIPTPVVNNVTGTFTNATAFHSALDTDCGANPVCAATSADGSYGGLATWGDLSAQLPFSAAANVGTTLFFYDIAQPDSPRVRGSDPAIVTAIAGGTAQFLLSNTGLLSYSVVPLPAAVWLLLAGLAGFGMVSRRRETPAAA